MAFEPFEPQPTSPVFCHPLGSFKGLKRGASPWFCGLPPGILPVPLNEQGSVEGSWTQRKLLVRVLALRALGVWDPVWQRLLVCQPQIQWDPVHQHQAQGQELSPVLQRITLQPPTWCTGHC